MEIPIFCINLKRAKERKKNIEEKWANNLGLNINFWNAYDRREIEKGNYIYKYEKNKVLEEIGRELSLGEIACATSFCLLYEHILKNDINEVLIMEDDIEPEIFEGQIIDKIIKKGKTEFPKSNIMLMHNPPSINEKNKSLIFNIKKNVFSQCLVPPWGNQLFYANAHAINFLYEFLKQMRCPADYPQREYAKKHTVIITNRPLCKHYWSGESAVTYIGNEGRNTKRKFVK